MGIGFKTSKLFRQNITYTLYSCQHDTSYGFRDLPVRYGYVTNTKIKFVIVVESSNTTLRDNEIRSVSINPTVLL